MRPVIIGLLTLSLILGIGAWKLDTNAGRMRDALPNSGAAAEIPVATPAVAVGAARLSADQTRLESDLRSAGTAGTGQSYTVRDTQRLIRDVFASSVSPTRRAHELRQALDAARFHPCAECLRLLDVAAGRS